MGEHIVKTYDQDLEKLNRAISEMGGLAEKMLSDAVDALGALDVDLANRVISTDDRVDALQRQVEDGAVLTIARRQPMAIDLRECVGSVRIAGDLERVGDLARNIAKRAVILSNDPPGVTRAMVGLRSMHDLAARQLKEVLNAYATRDAIGAKAVWATDVRLDALEDSVFRDLLTFMMEDASNITFCTHLLFCAKNLERIGDHTTNIAETVVYVVTGETLPADRPRMKPRMPATH